MTLGNQNDIDASLEFCWQSSKQHEKCLRIPLIVIQSCSVASSLKNNYQHETYQTAVLLSVFFEDQSVHFEHGQMNAASSFSMRALFHLHL